MLAVVTMAFVTACSSSDDGGGETVDVSKAVGTWYCVSSTDRAGVYDEQPVRRTFCYY